MGALRRTAVVSTFVLAFAVVSAIGSVSFAADPAVRYGTVSSDRDGIVVKGTIRVEVRNLTGGNMKNVDLRVAHPGPYSITKGLLQFGGIPAGDAKVVTGSYLFDEAALAARIPLRWRIDYDTEAGSHQQVIVPGMQIGQ